MVDQNGGKFQRFEKLFRKRDFYPNRKFFSQKFIGWYTESDENLKILTLWAL